MAEGTDKNAYSSLFMAGSEPVYDFYCEICRESGQNLEAAGFCVDCGDYLCETCLKHHKRTRFTLNHEILDYDEMSKDKPLPQDKCNRRIDTKCTTHRGMTVEYYCKGHDFFGCGTCITMGHRNCPNVDHIPEIPEDFEQNQEYKTFEANLNVISQKSTAVIQQARDNITRAENCCKRVVDAIRKQREEINKLLDEIENGLVKQTETFKSDNVQAMEILSSKAKSILRDAEKIISRLKNLQKSRKICQIYISTKQFSHEVKCMTSNLDEAENNNVVRMFEFEPSLKLKEMCKDVDAFGTLHFQKNAQACPKGVVENPLSTVAIRISDIQVGSKEKSGDCNISGLAVLSRNKLIAVDFNIANKVVSLLDTQSNKLLYDLKLTTPPWDVCAINGSQAAVTVPGDHKILVLKVTDILSVEREITVDGKCRGLACSRDRLVVTFENPPKLEIMDLQGNVIKRIQSGKGRDMLFQWPLHVCLSSDGETIYVSDHDANKVMRLTSNGEILSVYTDRKLEWPRKVCADKGGNIYVASRNKTVHMLTADCTKIKILLTEKDGLTSDVRSVSHCRETNRLYVGLYNDNSIKVFQLQ